MTQLYVNVRLNDTVAEQRLCAVNDEVWLGEMVGAAVAFPGPSVRVRRIGNRLQVQGRWLDPGEPMRVRRGNLAIRLEAVPGHRSNEGRWLNWPMPDLRVLVASAAVVLFGAWWEAVGSFIERHPGAVATLYGAHDVTMISEATVSGSLSTKAAPRPNGDDETNVNAGPVSHAVEFRLLETCPD